VNDLCQLGDMINVDQK